jgi:hypothetical protein
MRLTRALKAAWRAFAAEWKRVEVTVVLDLPRSSAVAPHIEVFGEAPPQEPWYRVVRFSPDPVIVYNETNGGEAGKLMCAERSAGNTATFAMYSSGQWQLRDWCPR